MKAALYIRVSTDDQAKEGYSIAAQKDRLTAYAISQDWEVYDYYIDDGFSAKDMRRPAFQRLLKDAQEQLFEVVLVYKLDRFTRNVRDLYDVLERFRLINVSFRSSIEQFDTTTTMGRAMIGMLGIFAQWERETIAERVTMGMEQKIASGKRNGAIAPMGYDLVDGQLVVNEDADFVRRLFRMYLTGMGMPSINETLAREGKSMHIKTLWYILHNPIYCNEFRWKFRSKGIRTHNPTIVDGDIEAIISKEDFYRVQAIIKSRDKKGRGATSDYLFSGLAKCARCGYPLNGGIRHNKKNSILFYRCSGRIGYGKCDLPRIRQEAIEDALFRELDTDRVMLASKIKAEGNKQVQSDIKKIQKDMEQIKKRREKWRAAFANDLISMEELRNYTDIEKQKEAALQLQLDEAKEDTVTLLTPTEVKQLFQNIREAWTQVDDLRSKKMFLNEIFSEITIDTDAVLPRSGRNNHYGCKIIGWKLVK